MNKPNAVHQPHGTLAANSFEKAAYIWNKYKTPCFAEDSGLEVAALDNAPGVYSARYAGLQKCAQDNITLLLSKLLGVTNRQAKFKTVITLMTQTTQQRFEGIVKGAIAQQPLGKNGFGYDPVFIHKGHTKTFAQMALKEKNKLSHRAMALQKLLCFVANL